MTNPESPAVLAGNTAANALELRRRDAFRLVFGASAAAMVGLDAAATVPTASPQFLHGVASGDPHTDSVIIWTRVTQNGRRTFPVEWQVSTTPDMTNVVASGSRLCTPNRDFTVKALPTGLTAGTTYWYRFTVQGVHSPVGRTRTLPAANSTAPFSLAVFSCSNYVKGFFNAYGEAAKDDGLFGMLHLGDYTYEYGPGEYQTTALALGLVTEPRAPQLDPMAETVTLAAYRARIALYRTDTQLQAAHQNFPWIAIYDDHESTNDSWTGGAENHTPGVEGDWQARKRAALQAWYEWMPVRERPSLFDAAGNPQTLYRHFDFGSLARLIMLDTRLAGRDEQLSVTAMSNAYGYYAQTGSWALDSTAGRPRSLMGADQEAWADRVLRTSRQTWQLIGNQTLMHYQIAPDFLNAPGLSDAQRAGISAGIDQIFGAGAGAQFGQLGVLGLPNPATSDSWNGYPTARNRLYASLAKARNPIVLTGDSHNAWVANLAVGATRFGVEFGGTSVASPGYEEIFVGFDPAQLAGLIVYSSAVKSQTDKLVYAELSKRGFMKVSVSSSQVVSTYVYVSTVFSTTYTTTSQSFTVQAGAKKVLGT
jgi:alkaline phosphatase D